MYLQNTYFNMYTEISNRNGNKVLRTKSITRDIFKRQILTDSIANILYREEGCERGRVVGNV